MGTVPPGAFFSATEVVPRQFRESLLQQTRVSGGVSPGAFEIALAKKIRDLVKRALFPLFGFSEPENPAFGIP
jgi:hypothetical protein